ncbi:MAG: N-acyl amino acid synthase FeeM domain-containing protein [Rhodanobacteraceae bacterium]
MNSNISAPGIVDITARLARPALRSSEPPCSCATSLEQVASAWRLVYNRYSQMGLIDANPFGVHAVPAAVGKHACVLWGPEGPDVGYTMTLALDNPGGLALDSVYAPYLDRLRRNGRRLLEIGMLADRRQSAARGMKALFVMMRWATHYGLHNDVNDVVIGVHPRHAQFYARCYGFEEFAPPTSYPLVRNNPVVALRCRLPELLAQDSLPRGLADARDNPIPRSAFSQRFAFEPEQLRGSPIAGFLKARYDIDPGRSAEPAVPLDQPKPRRVAYRVKRLSCAAAVLAGA